MLRCVFLCVVVAGVGRSAAAQAVPTLHVERDLTIDGKSADIADHGARIKVSASGTIAIAQPMATSLVLVDRDKSAIRIFGKGGSKAGAVNIFQWFGWIGDSLWVGDPSLDRLTVFKPDMSVARTEPMPPQIQGPVGTTVVLHGQYPPVVTAVYDDGTLLVNEFQLMPKGQHAAGYLLRVTRDGAFRRAIGTVPDGWGDCRYPDDGLPISGQSLFCAAPPASRFAGNGLAAGDGDSSASSMAPTRHAIHRNGA